MELKDYGIIVSSSDFRENDKILKIYTKTNGLLKVYAFGAKISKKRFVGNLVPFNLLNLRLKKSKDYITLEEVGVVKYFSQLTQNIINIKILFNISSLLTTERGHCETNIFKLLYFLLSNLNESKEDSERFKLYIIFCIYLLKKEGVINSAKECYRCKGRNIFFLASDDNSIYFKCQNCVTDREIISQLDKEFLSFIIQALNPKRPFIEQKFNKDFLFKIIQTIQPFLKRYFNVDIISF